MPEEFAPPQWVESGAEEANGLDLLALRAPVMRIGNRLLDGITTITPRIRYLTFVSWITLKYWERGGKDSRLSYLEFARRLEAAIVLGNLAVAPDTTGLVGVDTATAALEAGGAVPLAIDVRALAANGYSGPAEQLRLLETRSDAKVPHLTDARGIPLARALDAAVATTGLAKRLSSAEGGDGHARRAGRVWPGCPLARDPFWRATAPARRPHAARPDVAAGATTTGKLRCGPPVCRSERIEPRSRSSA